MSDTQEKELQVKEKTEVAIPAEQTRAGLVFNPVVDIFETENEITLLADMPGVNVKDLKIDLRDDTLSLSGEVIPMEQPDEQGVLKEYQVGTYFRQFALSEVIDQNRIDAQLKNGALRLTLPKAEKAVPRKITVKTG